MDNSLNFTVTILGNSAAIPTKTNHLSSQLLTYNGIGYLIDCGEGTQMQLVRYNIKFGIIKHVFISHLHGDHFFGLVGLISTFHLLGRDKPLNIYSPAPLKSIIDIQLNVTHTDLSYELIFHELQEDCLLKILETDNMQAYSFPLVHRVPTWGFKFIQRAKQKRIKKSFVEEYKPSVSNILKIKEGHDYEDTNGKIIPNSDITIPPPKPLSYAYCSDTKFDKSIIEYVKNSTLLYHEATFENSMQQRANDKFHSTARDAAVIAKEANVSQLLLGHFSARIKDLDKLKKEASEIFKPSFISEEGKDYKISH
jgi:ribonuclease Z